MPARRGSFGLRRLVVGSAVLALIASLAGLGIFTVRWMAGPTCQASAGGKTFAFTPEQMGNASIIASVALKRGLPARAATIALATAIQESGLRNLDHGDRDSVGLFQQRPSQGWGTVEEIMDPQYSAGKFYDALIKIDGYGSMPITEVAQEVQRSAYPTAYADHEDEGRALASTLAGHSPAGLACRLSEASTPGRVGAVAQALEDELGVTATATQEQLTVHTGASEQAWRVASWAVAHADRYAVQTVAVDGRQWGRGRGHDALQWQSAPSQQPATTVTITLAG